MYESKIKFKNYKTKEDYDLWLRILKKNYKFVHVKDFLTFYTVYYNKRCQFYEKVIHL
jgi:hypothetical protein